MRIVAGRWRGRRLSAPKGDHTRPTSERVREALFNILEPLEAGRVLDLFSGTGALALEALSRGATYAVCVENDRRALSVLRENVIRLDASTIVRIHSGDVGKYLRSPCSEPPFELILADPPWSIAAAFLEEHLEELTARLAPGGALVLERDRRDGAPAERPNLSGPDVRTYGDTLVAIYRRRSHSERV